MAEFFPPGFLPEGYLPDGYVAGDGAGGTYVDGAAVVTGSGGLTATATVTRRSGVSPARMRARTLEYWQRRKRYVDGAATVAGSGRIEARASVMVSAAAVVTGSGGLQAAADVIDGTVESDNGFWMMAA
jgi:hypothetical protein